MQKKHLILALIIYVASAVASYTVFSAMNQDGGSTSSDAAVNEESETGTALSMLLEIDATEPKDQACPLNGQLLTATEKNAWEQRRPLFVMVENSVDARPQSGLSRADIVFETIAEGGVTRFGVIFYCAAQKQEVVIAPVRSARSYFVDWASGFNYPMYIHVGGANVSGPTNALGQIKDYGWEMQNDINQFSVGYPTFVRNYNRVEGKEVATEHTMESSTEKLWTVAAKRDWTNLDPEGDEWLAGFETWSFEQDPVSPGTVERVHYDFWSGYNDYSVDWYYDASQDVFLRSQGGAEHIDLNNNERVAAANVIIIKTTEKGPINEKKHMIYGTVGTGDALIFKHGDVIEANWVKKTRVSELQFTDNRGLPIELAPGMTWISVVGIGTEVIY